MTGNDSGRRYTVTQRDGTGKVITEVRYEDPSVALSQFRRCLQGAGHDERKLLHFLRTWTCMLMQGADGFEVLDPGLNGSISIRITTAVSTQRPDAG